MPDMPPALRNARVAIVHDYLNQSGGAENVLAVMAEMFPEAPLFTSVYDADRMPGLWRGRDIRTSFLQRISPRLSVARTFLPLYPLAFEQFDFREYDLVLSSTASFAKGVITRPETCHVCYCNNPTRFLWMYHDYFEYERFPAPVQTGIAALLSPMRVWDYAAAQRVDVFVAGSHNASRRIAKYYRRDSEVIHSPIDAQRFAAPGTPRDYFLIVSRLQSYKRIDLAIEACNRLEAPLLVVGDGPDRKRLEAMAGPTVRMLGRCSDDDVCRLLAGCRAFLFPGEEDFGLTPLEAQASGRPVIAYGAGGALETILDGETGLFFCPQTVESLAACLRDFQDTFDPERLREHAMRFDKERFKERLFDLLERSLIQHRDRLRTASAR